MPSTECLLLTPQTTFWLMDTVVTWAAQGSFWFGCPALECSLWLGLLLTSTATSLWNVCILSPTCPFSSSLYWSPLFFLHFYHNLHCPFKGGYLRKQSAFLEFYFFLYFSFFVLCSDIVQKCIMRGQIFFFFFFASNELFIILWTNSRDLKQGKGV